MLAQHEAHIQALESLGVTVELQQADAAFPDGCFVEDVAVITRDCAVIARPGAPSRRGESVAIEPLLAARRDIVRIEAPGHLDGGDVVIAGECVLVGLSGRTDTEGARQLGRMLAEHGLHTRTIRVNAGLHLKSSVNFLGDGRLLLTSEYADCDALVDFEHVLVPAGEEYAANCVACGDQILLPSGYPGTQERLERLGFAVHALAVSEFRKMDGGLSCLSLRLG